MYQLFFTHFSGEQNQFSAAQIGSNTAPSCFRLKRSCCRPAAAQMRLRRILWNLETTSDTQLPAVQPSSFDGVLSHGLRLSHIWERVLVHFVHQRIEVSIRHRQMCHRGLWLQMCWLITLEMIWSKSTSLSAWIIHTVWKVSRWSSRSVRVGWPLSVTFAWAPLLMDVSGRRRSKDKPHSFLRLGEGLWRCKWKDRLSSWTPSALWAPHGKSL